MKKKILSFILSFCFLLTGMFALTACGNESSANMSKSELATTFKSVAKQSWDKLGAGDPTIESSSQTVTSKNITLMSIDKSSIPNEMTEQTGDNAVNIKASAATMIAYVYMIGEYYENENFVASSKVVTFDMDNLILPNEKTTYSYDNKEYAAYKINLTWEYVSALGYDKKGEVGLIEKDNKLYIVSSKGVSE